MVQLKNAFLLLGSFAGLQAVVASPVETEGVVDDFSEVITLKDGIKIANCGPKENVPGVFDLNKNEKLKSEPGVYSSQFLQGLMTQYIDCLLDNMEDYADPKRWPRYTTQCFDRASKYTNNNPALMSAAFGACMRSTVDKEGKVISGLSMLDAPKICPVSETSWSFDAAGGFEDQETDDLEKIPRKLMYGVWDTFAYLVGCHLMGMDDLDPDWSDNIEECWKVKKVKNLTFETDLEPLFKDYGTCVLTGAAS